MTWTNDTETMRRLMTTPGRWAVVGLSANTERTAYRIAAFLKDELGPRHSAFPKGNSTKHH